MKGKSFAEKILGADAGSIVFKKPDIVLSHDNTASIQKTFQKMGGQRVLYPKQLMLVLDHNAPPTTAKLANDYQQVREFAKTQKISRFHDSGSGICHQLMEQHAKPGMIIVGSDSHTCTAGAFNCFAAGIDRTETAGIWKNGETWFRVPESIKITLKGKLKGHVSGKDLALWIIGMIGSSGANYCSIEFHGEALRTIGMSDRMTIANMASEMGAKNAVFPPDEVLKEHYRNEVPNAIWADTNAKYARTIQIDLEEVIPVVACPHHVDNVKAVAETEGILIQQGLIGTCTNGRIEDIRLTAQILKGEKIADGFQLLIAPASKDVFKQALFEGHIASLIESGANILSPSCGPCLGTGQGIPADGMNVISTSNRNFLGRMGNKNANIYLASPETVACTALKGKICNPQGQTKEKAFPFKQKQSKKVTISDNELRRHGNVWNYKDVDNLNTDQMFAGHLTYEINSSEADKIIPHLFKGFDSRFNTMAQEGDILICGDNFGCGSSREHPAVGLAVLGIKAVLVKSVSRIFYRSAINQGLPILVLPEAVTAYQPGNELAIYLEKGLVDIAGNSFQFSPLPQKLKEVMDAGGLVKFLALN